MSDDSQKNAETWILDANGVVIAKPDISGDLADSLVWRRQYNHESNP